MAMAVAADPAAVDLQVEACSAAELEVDAQREAVLEAAPRTTGKRAERREDLASIVVL